MAKQSPFASKLAKLKAAWGKSAEEAASTPAGDFKNLPPGRYTAQITDGEINESQSSGRLQCFMEFTVVEGEQCGEGQRKYWGLDKPENLKYLHMDVVRLGYSIPESPEELETLMAQIVKDKPTVNIRIKEDGEYVNLYIQKRLNVEETEAEAPQAEAPQAAEAAPEAPAAEAQQEEEGAISLGMRLFVLSAKENGEVKAIDEAEGELTIKLDSGKKVIVTVDDLEPEHVPELPKKGLRVIKK